MAKAGDELVNPVTGLRTVFRKTAQDTGGELLQVDWIGDPGWTTGPDHVHPLQEERFEVICGKLGLRVEGIERVLGEREGMIFGVLAKVARLLGYRAEYPYARRSETSQAGMQPNPPQRTT